MSGNNGNSSETTRWICSICGAANSNITHTCEKCGESKTSDAKVISYNETSANYAKGLIHKNNPKFPDKFEGETYYFSTQRGFRFPWFKQRTVVTVEGEHLNIEYFPASSSPSYIELKDIKSAEFGRAFATGYIVLLVIAGLLLFTEFWYAAFYRRRCFCRRICISSMMRRYNSVMLTFCLNSRIMFNSEQFYRLA